MLIGIKNIYVIICKSYYKFFSTKIFKYTEMLGILDSPELFPILVVHYRIMGDTGKIMEKMEFNES